MSAIIKIECIGDDVKQEMQFYRNMIDDVMPGAGDMVVGHVPSRCWVAEITGHCNKYKYERRFLRPKKDYSESNALGSRGVYAYYILEENKLYEVSAPQSWKKIDRYFCTVKDEKIARLTESEVIAWLKDT